jgi:DNA repair protein RecN (Recombination protein N)
MLQFLHIQNYVIAQLIHIELNRGLSVLTGETGAGKSILLDALGLVLGDRADSAAVRQGAESAEITASFDLTELPHLQCWLKERGLEDEEVCFLRRVVGADGRSRAFINGRPTSLSLLRELGSQLVDIHGQHEHQSLIHRATQLQIIDRFGQLEEAAQQIAQHYTRWRDLENRREALLASEAESQARRDLLTFQLDELNALNLADDEYESLCQRQEMLSHIDETLFACQKSAQLLDGEEAGNISDLLRSVLHTLELPVQRVEELAPSYEELQSALIQLEEAARTLRQISDRLESDPDQLSTLESRLRLIHDLARKHRCPPNELVALHSELAKEYEELDQLDSSLQTLNEQLSQTESHFRSEALALSKKRLDVCSNLSEIITAKMQDLGMSDGRFYIELKSDPERFSLSGHDQIEFQVSANPGQPLRSLAKVASGGELSRISLALQVAVAGSTTIPTLIFDEVDSGIGGPVAEVVGQQLAELGCEVQVLCVTHLAQVASQAQHHFCVKKSKGSSETTTEITPLDFNARIEETARMSAGVEITEATLNHAREMIERGAQHLADSCR